MDFFLFYFYEYRRNQILHIAQNDKPSLKYEFTLHLLLGYVKINPSLFSNTAQIK